MAGTVHISSYEELIEAGAKEQKPKPNPSILQRSMKSGGCGLCQLNWRQSGQSSSLQGGYLTPLDVGRLPIAVVLISF